MKVLSRAGRNPEAVITLPTRHQGRCPFWSLRDAQDGHWLVLQKCLQKTARQSSEKLQVRLWRLLRCGVCDM